MYRLDNFYKNCPQFGKDVIKIKEVVFMKHPVYCGVWAWKCLLTPTGLWRYISQNDVVYRPNPEKTLLARKHVVWVINRENRSNSSTWRRSVKKSQMRYISPIRRKASTEPIWIKIYIGVVISGIIMCAKFRTKFLHGSNFRISYWFLHEPYSMQR